MEIIKDIKAGQIPANVATIGFFDGVHCGHRDLIEQVRAIAAERGLKSLLVTFKTHPRTVIETDYVPELLSTTNEKLCLLAETKADLCFPLDFTKSMAQLTAKEFMKEYLRDMLNVKVLIVGYDNHFGKGGKEGLSQYKKYGQELGIEVIGAKQFQIDGQNVSSSSVRFCLQVGDVQKAELLLGRPYGFDGIVVKGEQLGQTIGFPTANINPAAIHKMLPMDGSYAVKVEYLNEIYAGMMNIGFRPTFTSVRKRTVEVYILNFADEIYDEEIHEDFVQRLRAEKRFNTREELREQLRKDVERVEKVVKL
jgi:riboflavin kinase/FMN adenylyltransferase